MKILLAATVASLATAFGMHAVSGSASTATTFSLHQGDYVRVPALHWTCRAWRWPNRQPGLFCTHDAKPFAAISISPKLVAVGTGTRPMHFHNEFAFRY